MSQIRSARTEGSGTDDRRAVALARRIELSPLFMCAIESMSVVGSFFSTLCTVFWPYFANARSVCLSKHGRLAGLWKACMVVILALE